jgi:hypothetical protein
VPFKKGVVSVALLEATYWEESPEGREAIAPLSDVRCLLCRHSLEGHPFIAWWTGAGWGPDPQVVVGMHLQHGYHLALGMLKDVAAAWYLDPSALSEWLDSYTQQVSERGGTLTPIPPLAEEE